MEDLKMILNDGTEITIDEFALPFHVVINCNTEAEAVEKRVLLTPENLSDIKIQYGSKTLLEFVNVCVNGIQYVFSNETAVTAHFYLDGELVSTEAEFAEAGKIIFGGELLA